MNFWNTIVQSNTFNFAVLLLIFAVLYKKMNISLSIDKLKNEIIQRIENAKLEHNQAEINLTKAVKSVENLEDEIKAKLADASLRADGLAKQIEKNAQEQIKLIKKNVQKVIAGEEKTLSAQMSQNVLKSAIELAKQQIVKTLEETPELHNKFIEESIGEI